MMRVRHLARHLAVLTLCGASLACQAEPPEQLTAEPDHPPPPAASGVEPTGAPGMVPATDAELLLPPSAAEQTERPKLHVRVSEQPAADPDKRLLVGYERLGQRRNREHLEVSTDRNAVEFPRSATRARVRGVPVPAEVGAGPGRAMSLQFRLEQQRTEYAACIGQDRCGCEDIKPYAYVSLAHTLPADTRFGEFEALSFWARSAEPFQLHVILSCYVEERPLSTVAPHDGYLDAEHTRMNPCWHSPRVELALPEPIEIRGGDVWHRYEVTIDGLPASEPVDLRSGGQMVCTLEKVKEIAYVLKKDQPSRPGEHPRNEGLIFFDDLEGLPTPAPSMGEP